MSVVWLNGKILAAHTARIDPADRGFTLGDGVFETVRVEDGTPRHFSLHLERMRLGASVLGIACRWDDSALGLAARGLLAANALSDAVLRLTLTGGPAERGVVACGPMPTLLMACGPLPPSSAPAKLVIARTTRRNEHSPLSRIKSLNYGDSILARREALDRGADDALLLNSHGDLAEATAANVLLRMGGAWLTPRIEDGALPGIARRLLLEGGHVQEARISGASIRKADAITLINALSSRPCADIEGHVLALSG